MEEPLQIGRYEILERVGRGSMGVLYRGRDTLLDREVAVKVMNGDFTGDDEARTRFFREARAAARLQHRNIVTVFEFADHDGTPYIVMEFLRGSSLAKRLTGGPPMSLLEKLSTVIQLCEGLEFAHEHGVVHRDVKPGNIWLCADGLVKLLDFGIAKSPGSAITAFGDVMGSPAYMSPEQVAGRDLDRRSDIFSAGVVMYEMLSGHKPFEGDSPTAVMLKIVNDAPQPLTTEGEALPPSVCAVVERALLKDRNARYGRAADLAADLEVARRAARPEPLSGTDFTIGETIYREPVTTVGLPASVSDSRTAHDRKPIIAVAAAILAIALAVAGLWSMRGPSRGPAGAPPASEPAAAKPTDARRVEPGAGGGASSGGSPQAAATVALTVNSVPSGAIISVDGRNTGKRTPAAIELASSDRPRLGVTLPGHKPGEQVVTDRDVQAGAVTVRLERIQPGTVQITGSYAFEVLEDGHTVGPSSDAHTIPLPAGRHTLQLRAREVYLDQSIRVDVVPGKTTGQRAPGLGPLDVRAPQLEGQCRVNIDGREVDYPPIKVQVAEGAHVVQLKCSNGRTASPSGQPLSRRVQVELNRPEIQIFK